MDKYAEYLDDTDDSSTESTNMMREAMAHTQVFMLVFLFLIRFTVTTVVLSCFVL